MLTLRGAEEEKHPIEPGTIYRAPTPLENRGLVAGGPAGAAEKDVSVPVAAAGRRREVDGVAGGEGFVGSCQIGPDANAVILIAGDVEDDVLICGVLPAL